MPLTVTNVNPARGMVDGGDKITITGTNFANSVRVTFGNKTATDIQRVSATTIHCKTPKQDIAGNVAVSVTNDPSYIPYMSGPTASWGNQFRTYPRVTKVTPNELAAYGGETVTIEGLGFPVGSRVSIRSGGNDYFATNVVRVSATKITCQVPQHPAGRQQLRVLYAHPDNIGAPFNVHYCEPLISSLSPPKGRLAGNTDVVITGKHFAINAAVHFDGTLSNNIVRNSSTQITARTANHVAGRVAVRVTNPQIAAVLVAPTRPAVPQLATTLSNAYEFANSEVLSIEPSRGPAGGGTDVTIKGRGLLALAVNGVQIGGVAATNQNRVSDTTVTATTAAAPAGPGNISIQNSAGDAAAVLANGFTFVVTPTVTRVEPDGGPGRVQVTIHGTDFEEGATVTFGGREATEVEVVSTTAIRCRTPIHPRQAADVVVRNPDGDPGTLNGGYTFRAFRVEPSRGPVAGGTHVVIHRWFPPEDTPDVSFDDDDATVNTLDPLDVTIPAHAAGQVDVSVDDSTLQNAFEYAAIWKVEPSAGPAGTTVDVYGAGFDHTTAVALDGNNAVVVNVVSATQIQVTAPAHVNGAVDVVVTNAGAGTFASGYTYQAAPTVTAIEPVTGTNAGGTTVTITGTNFVEGATVNIGGSAANNVEVVSPTTIRATTPATLLGAPYAAVAVTVQNPGAAAAVSGGNLWTYRNPPVVTAVANPASGSSDGGRSITIRGTDFLDKAKVLVGGTEATDVEFVNGTTLHCRVPAHAAGQVAVAVHNPGDPNPGAARANTFTYIADPHTPTGGNHVAFLRDGEIFFDGLERLFELIRVAPPDPDGLTYVRLAFWNAHDDVTLGPRAKFTKANHQLLKYVEQVVRVGHHVEMILWRPKPLENSFGMGKGVFDSNKEMATKLYEIDVAMAAVEGAGRVRVYFEHSEGAIGSSIHQKIAIFSIGGIRHVIIGGINLSLGYFGSATHDFPALVARCRPWHDASVYIRGPATDDIEAEWMRRWSRTRALETEWFGSMNLQSCRGEFMSRDFTYFAGSTVRQREITTPSNTKHQPNQAQNTTLTIATTRSEGTTYHTHIRDKIVERINAANNYIYFENYHFCDPVIVQAIVARHAARAAANADLKVAVVVPDPMGRGSSYLTRRAWLHFALTFEDGTTAPAATPYCTRVVYDLGLGGGNQTVMRAACGANWAVNDCYDPNDPTATNWLEDDTLVFNPGTGPVTVRFHQIVAVESAIHFYCPKYRHGTQATPYNTLYTHSKVAAFDGQWLVVGSANWSYRSMVYDAEISAFINSGLITQGAVTGLLGHYNMGVVAPTPLNVEAQAIANAAANAPNAIRLYPLELYDSTAAIGANNPSRKLTRAVPPSPSMDNIQAFLANPSEPNFTWL